MLSSVYLTEKAGGRVTGLHPRPPDFRPSEIHNCPQGHTAGHTAQGTPGAWLMEFVIKIALEG